MPMLTIAIVDVREEMIAREGIYTLHTYPISLDWNDREHFIKELEKEYGEGNVGIRRPGFEERTEHEGFVILHFRPKKRTYYRIYDAQGEFKQTSSRLKDAKRLIDFCIRHEIWKPKKGPNQ